MLSNYKEVQQSTTHEELLDASIIVNETENMNAATEKLNLTAETGNCHKHQQKKEKDKKPNK